VWNDLYTDNGRQCSAQLTLESGRDAEEYLANGGLSEGKRTAKDTIAGNAITIDA
jgi:hypothetical protein